MLRNLLSICCLSEAVAVALIGAERLEMPEGELHACSARSSPTRWATRASAGDFLDTVADAIVPGLAAHGLSSRAAWAAVITRPRAAIAPP